MPVLKISLTTEEEQKLAKLAKATNLSFQDYIRFQIFGEKNPEIFTPEEAERRALEKFTADETFTLPDIYGDDWAKLNPRMSGVFGKRFFNYLKKTKTIEFVKMTTGGRRATYRIMKGE